MRMHVKTNPAYAQFEQHIMQVVSGEVDYEKVYKDDRNFVGRISTGGKSFVVKHYRYVPLWKKTLYSTILKSKARQAYEKAEYLLQHDIETAPPAAYVEIRKMGLYHTSFFISEYLPYIPGRRMWHLIKVRREREKLLAGYMNFKKTLKDKGIDITDTDPNNTLVYKVGDQYHFAQIDINHIKIDGWYHFLKKGKR